MATNNATSTIAVALAGKTASVDIPKPRDHGFASARDNFTAVAAKTMPNQQASGLPTPPNSISPNLPPHGFKAHVQAPDTPPSAPTMVDSDIDLQDAVDHANSQDQPHHGHVVIGAKPLLDIDTAGAITTALLAKHHLPEILLKHGPLAIRHVMGYLTTSVPGFSRIPPAKARRLVVGALEGRGNGGEPGGLNGEVEFDKVGWGRWDARVRGHPPRDGQHDNFSPPASIPSSYSPVGLQIPNGGSWGAKARDVQSGTSMAGDSAVFSHSEMDYGEHEDVTMLEHEADKMSLDGNDDEYCSSSSEAPDDGPILEEDGDMTDEEDWASIGAAALRARSLPRASGGGRIYNNNPLLTVHSKSFKSRGGGPSASALAKSVPTTNLASFNTTNNMFSFPDGAEGDSQERAAVEALLRLGSM